VTQPQDGRFPVFTYGSRWAQLAALRGWDSGDPDVRQFVREAEYRDQQLEAWLEKSAGSAEAGRADVFCFTEEATVAVAEGDVGGTHTFGTWTVTLEAAAQCAVFVVIENLIVWDYGFTPAMARIEWVAETYSVLSGWGNVARSTSIDTPDVGGNINASYGLLPVSAAGYLSVRTVLLPSTTSYRRTSLIEVRIEALTWQTAYFLLL
jgi:hypothetical protein